MIYYHKNCFQFSVARNWSGNRSHSNINETQTFQGTSYNTNIYEGQTNRRNPYNSKSTIRKRIRTENKPGLVCKESGCGQRFASEPALYMHIGAVHKEKFFCPTCGKVYATKVGLAEHTKVHQGSYRYNCHICNKGIMIKSHYEAHINSHMGLKPFQCTVCNKTFTYKTSLTQHQINCF